MTEKELLKYVPHPKKCMADAFDANPGVQCNEPRAGWWMGVFPFQLDDQKESQAFDIINVKVHLCTAHETYRNNGGTFGMGPVLLRAAAELLKQHKRASAPSRPVRRQDKEKSV